MALNPYVDDIIRKEYRTLVINYGILRVHEVIQKEMLQMRQDLEAIFGPKPTTNPPVVANDDEKTPEEAPATDSNPVEKKYPTREEEKDKKKKHLELVAKKKEEMKAEGKDPYSLLTQENLKKWIEEEGYSYWKIAETTGVNDTEVSAMAKQFGLKSKISLLAFARK